MKSFIKFAVLFIILGVFLSPQNANAAEWCKSGWYCYYGCNADGTCRSKLSLLAAADGGIQCGGWSGCLEPCGGKEYQSCWTDYDSWTNERDCQPCEPTNWCGDGSCNGNENCGSCSQDCGECRPPPGEEYCGDGYCNRYDDCHNCPQDCGTCPEVNYCGNGYCEGYRGEDCSSCEIDCGSCNWCGDGRCDGSESCYNCVDDCGRCQPQSYCDDNTRTECINQGCDCKETIYGGECTNCRTTTTYEVTTTTYPSGSYYCRDGTYCPYGCAPNGWDCNPAPEVTTTYCPVTPNEICSCSTGFIGKTDCQGNCIDCQPYQEQPAGTCSEKFDQVCPCSNGATGYYDCYGNCGCPEFSTWCGKYGWYCPDGCDPITDTCKSSKQTQTTGNYCDGIWCENGCSENGYDCKESATATTVQTGSYCRYGMYCQYGCNEEGYCNNAPATSLPVTIKPSSTSPVIQSSIPTEGTVPFDTSQMVLNREKLNTWCTANPDACKKLKEDIDKQTVATGTVATLIAAGVITAPAWGPTVGATAFTTYNAALGSAQFAQVMQVLSLTTTAYTAWECSNGNRAACEAGFAIGSTYLGNLGVMRLNNKNIYPNIERVDDEDGMLALALGIPRSSVPPRINTANMPTPKVGFSPPNMKTPNTITGEFKVIRPIDDPNAPSITTRLIPIGTERTPRKIPTELTDEQLFFLLEDTMTSKPLSVQRGPLKVNPDLITSPYINPRMWDVINKPPRREIIDTMLTDIMERYKIPINDPILRAPSSVWQNPDFRIKAIQSLNIEALEKRTYVNVVDRTQLSKTLGLDVSSMSEEDLDKILLGIK